ncbi:MAG: hypothetical protein JW836_04580 [Deltaproteobacteria bacterium]|nr:hypothetical protein [Deltaproteobacteria bacterium]
MQELSLTFRHGPKVFAETLLIIFLSIMDAFLTLDLVDRGAKELNPIMAYYLDRGPLLFFTVKYLLTCASIVIILSITKTRVFGGKFRVKTLLVFYILALALVVKWQLILLYYVGG